MAREKFTFDPKPPSDAYKFWQDKVPMGKAEFNKLAEDERVKAFVISGMAKGDQLTAMHRSIDNALATGQSMAAWKKDVAKMFAENGWEPMAGFRLDTIFRTNIQTAYSVGRYGQMMDVADIRPFWRYWAVNDGRTRPVHKALHGRVIRCDDPFWDTFYPPNGFRCRCTVTSLSEKQMAQKGLTAETIKPGDLVEPMDKQGMAIPAMPDKNFDTNPAKAYWKADTGRFRADVRQMVLKDFTRACPEEFSGPCEFAETDCFKRLRKHLTQDDLTDLQTLVWAEGFRQKKGFEQWVAEVLDRMQEKGEVYPVGNLPLKVLRNMEKQPRLALVTIDDKQIIHLARTAKKNRGAVLTAEEIKQIPSRFATSDWYRDTMDPALLMTWVQSGGRWVKVVIRTDFNIGKKDTRIANHIVTGGVVDEDNIVRTKKADGETRYEKI
jgi:SPP1 gp7 family putative phage head morphogenesis protein